MKCLCELQKNFRFIRELFGSGAKHIDAFKDIFRKASLIHCKSLFCKYPRSLFKNSSDLFFSFVVVSEQFVDRNVEVICDSRDHFHIGIAPARLPTRNSLRGYSERFCKIILRSPVAAAQFADLYS